MRSNLGRFHRPMSRGAMGDMLTMNSLGDGSTLSLDFTTGVLDPRLTFSRASTATFVNSSGYVEYAGANLFLQSENISSASWADQAGATRLQVSITNPIGGATSTQVTASGSGSNAIYQSPTYQAGLPHVIRIWARAGTSSQLQIGVFAGSGFVTGSISVVSGTATVSGTGLFGVTGLTSTWTQLQIVYTSLTASGQCYIYPDGASSPVAGTTIYLWGAQLNPGSTAQTYYPTTTAAYHAPRFDYSPTTIGEPRGLLIEGQAVNLTTRSEDFASADWTKDNSGGLAPVVTTVSATTPANGSTVNQIVFNKTGGVFSRVSRSSVGTTSSAYTMSVWMRTVSGTANVGLRIGADPAGFNCAVTTTWKRFQYTYTLSSTDSSAQIMLWDNIVGNDETATVYVWGCQVELGSGASSYIPTGASGVTRNLDNCVMTGTNFSSWFNNTEGTCLFVGDNIFVPAASNFATNWAFINAANSQRIHNYTRHTSGRLGASARDSGGTALTFDSPTGSPTNITTTAVYKTAFALKTNDFAYCVNGNTVGLGDGNGVFETVTSIEFARDAIRNGHIKQFKFFPTRLPNAQLQTLTAP